MITLAGMKEIEEKSAAITLLSDFEVWLVHEQKRSKKGTWRRLDLSLAIRVLKCSDCVTDFVERLSNSRQMHGVDWDMLGSEQDIHEVEANNNCDYSSINSRVPQVPFGFLNAAWEGMKISMQPGDKIREFCSSDDSWEHLAGHSGYCLVRGNKIVSVMTLVRS